MPFPLSSLVGKKIIELKIDEIHFIIPFIPLSSYAVSLDCFSRVSYNMSIGNYRQCGGYFDQIKHISMNKTINKICLQTKTSRNKYIKKWKRNGDFISCLTHAEPNVDVFII